MQTLGLGSKFLHGAKGFTLLELLIVITIMAIATAGVSFAFRGNDETALIREAERLSSVLETARVQSRSSGLALVWLPVAGGYSILPSNQSSPLPEKPQTLWSDAQTTASILGTAKFIALGAEPMLPAQVIDLKRGDKSLRISSDGLRPFQIADSLPVSVTKTQ